MKCYFIIIIVLTELPKKVPGDTPIMKNGVTCDLRKCDIN